MKLSQLLEFLEENIDIQHVKKVEKLHLNAIHYKTIPILPISISFPIDDKIKPYSYSEAFEDPEKMLYNELAVTTFNAYNSVKLKDYYPMQIRSNHGIGIIASLFGAKCKIVNNNMPWVEHFETLEDIKRIISHGVPECDKALGRKVKETHQFFLYKLKQYPKCFEAVHISQPDMQGPFDIAHLLLGSNIFYEIFDNSEILNELLDLITETYISFRKFIEPYLNDRAGEDCIYVHNAIYGGKVIIKDDTALINLSEDLYKKFSKQYNERIINKFKGGSLHYCGPMCEWHNRNIMYDNLKTLNFGNPEMHNLTEKYPILKGKKVSVVGWGDNQGIGYINEFLKTGVLTGVTLSANAESYEKAKDFLQKYLDKANIT